MQWFAILFLLLSSQVALAERNYWENIGIKNNLNLRLYEATANGSNYLEQKAQSSLGANYTVTWPAATGTPLLEDNTATVTNKTYSNAVISGYGLFDNQTPARFEEGGGGSDYVGILAPTSIGTSYNLTLPTGQGSANQTLVNDGSGNMSWGESGGGLKTDYFADADAESNVTTGWTAYKDAAATTPADGTGGTPDAQVTFTNQNTTNISGTRGGARSYQLSKDASDRQGNGYSYEIDFAPDSPDRNKVMRLQFNYQTSANYANDDVYIGVYDRDNAALISFLDTDWHELKSCAAACTFQAEFMTTDADDYRVIFHIASTNASAYDIQIDDLIFSGEKGGYAPAVGPVTSYTPTFNGLGTVTGIETYYQRVGESIFLWGRFTIGTVTAAEARIGLPTGLTIGTITSSTAVVGKLTANSTAVNFHTLATTGDAYLRVGYYGTTFDWPTVRNGSGTFGSGETLGFFTGPIPIAEWAGKGVVNTIVQDNLKEWQTVTPTGTLSTNVTYTGKWRKIGDEMEYHYTLSFSGANTQNTSVEVALPSGYTIDTDKLPTTTNYKARLGDCHFYRSSTATYNGFVGYFSAASNILSTFLTLESDPAKMRQWNPSLNDPATIQSGDALSCRVKVPIEEWAGSQTSLVGNTQATSANAGLISREADGTWTAAESAKSNLTGTGTYATGKYTRLGRVVVARIDTISGYTITTAATQVNLTISTTGLPGFTNTTHPFSVIAYGQVTASPNEMIPCVGVDSSNSDTNLYLSCEGGVQGVANSDGLTIQALGFMYYTDE